MPATTAAASSNAGAVRSVTGRKKARTPRPAAPIRRLRSVQRLTCRRLIWSCGHRRPGSFRVPSRCHVSRTSAEPLPEGAADGARHTGAPPSARRAWWPPPDERRRRAMGVLGQGREPVVLATACRRPQIGEGGIIGIRAADNAMPRSRLARTRYSARRGARPSSAHQRRRRELHRCRPPPGAAGRAPNESGSGIEISRTRHRQRGRRPVRGTKRLGRGYPAGGDRWPG